MNWVMSYLSKRMVRKSDKQEEEGFKWAMYSFYKKNMSLAELRSESHWSLEVNHYDVHFNLGAKEAIYLLEDNGKALSELSDMVIALKPKKVEAPTSKKSKQRIIKWTQKKN